MKRELSQSSIDQINSVLVRAPSLCNVLINDVNRALKESKEAKDDVKPYQRRIFVRAFFALVEGFCFFYRYVMLNCAELTNYKFSDQEILKLKELREAIDRSSGKPKQIQAWLEIEENLKMSFEWTAKFIGTEFKLDTSSDGYRALLEAKRIRNDLMHPKRASALLISDSEFKSVEKALGWFLNEITRLNEKMAPIRSGDLIKASVERSSS